MSLTNFFSGLKTLLVLIVLGLSNVTVTSSAAQASSTVDQSFQDFAAAFMSGNFDALPQAWDHSWNAPLLLPAESDSPLTSWSDIEAYYDAFSLLGSVEYKTAFETFSQTQISGDVTSALVKLTWAAKFPGQNGSVSTMGGELFITVLLRKIDGDWRFIQWIEAPRGALTELGNFYAAKGEEIFAKDE